MTLPVLVAALGAVVTIWLTKRFSRKANNIPGPWGWPVVGYMPYLHTSVLHRTMRHLTKKFGSIYKIRMGSFDCVVLTEFQHVKKAFQNQEFSSRPSLYLFELTSHESHGLVVSSGERWTEQRRFALRHLRDLGMGRSDIETHVQREVLEFVERMKKSVGQPIDLNYSLNISIMNILWALVAGKRMAHDDPVFLGFMAALHRNVEVGFTMGIVGFIPWLRKCMPRSWLKVDLIEESLGAVEEHFKDIIKEHKDNFNPDDLRDYTDHFIAEQKRQGENSTFSDLQLIVSMGDFFVAGSETTGTTLRWAVLLLSYHPEVQSKMQREIDHVVGKERLPTLADRERMPYTNAVINEAQRFADIAPMGLFHASENDVEFEGFNIPKGTMVMGYVGEMHRSPKYWTKPDEFYPENFLDEEGNLRKNVEGFLPFSTGRRSCIGENLARTELYYFITYFFQAFNFTICQDDPKPSLECDPKSGLIRWPSPFKVVLEAR